MKEDQSFVNSIQVAFLVETVCEGAHSLTAALRVLVLRMVDRQALSVVEGDPSVQV